MPSEHVLETASLATVVDECPDAVVLVDASSMITYANAAVSAVFGYEASDLVGRKYDLLIPDGRREEHARHHDAYMDRPVRRPMGRGLLLRARHADGYDFDVTIALVPVHGAVPLVAAIVREVTSEQRVIARLSATNELLTAALGGASRTEVERRSVELVCDVLDSESAWLVATEGSERPPVLVAGVGPGDWEPILDELDEAAIPGYDVISCPVGTPGRSLQLLVRRPSPPREFGPLDQQILCEFAGALAITIELIDARAEVEYLRSMADHDRIARDLHDRVIQRLFAIAMRLESVASGATTLERGRIGEAVDGLDEVIREIRTTIFDLRRAAGQPSLRTAVATEIDEVAFVLGFAPSLRFVGSIDDSVGRSLAEEAPIVVRELLANVVRHSQARTVDVTVYTDEHLLRVVVDDDGVGVGQTAVDGDGFRNLRERASSRKGSFIVSDRDLAGTTATWSVPIGDDAA